MAPAHSGGKTNAPLILDVAGGEAAMNDGADEGCLAPGSAGS